MLEICSGQGPGASGCAQISPAKVDVAPASSSVSGGGSEQVAQRNVYDVLGADAAGESLNKINPRLTSCLQVWDDELEQSATQWAETCHWDHGPEDLLMSIGQNLAVHSGR